MISGIPETPDRESSGRVHRAGENISEGTGLLKTDRGGAVAGPEGAAGEDDAALRASEETARARLAELEAIYRSAPVGLCVLDRELRYVRINERLAEINGIPAAEHLGRTVREVLPGLPAAVEGLRRVLETGEPALDVEVVGETPAQPGVVRTWVEQWLPIRDMGGRVVGINIVAHEVTAARAAATERERLLAEARAARAKEKAARERTARLQALTAALSTASTREEVADAVVRHATAAFDAVGTVVALVGAGGRTLEILRALDMPDDVGAEWRSFPMDAPAPLADAARTGEPVYLASRADWEARYPHLLPVLDAAGHQGNAVLPLVLEGRVIGVLGVAFTAPRTLDAEDRALALAVAQQCAQALERARLFESERAARAEAEAANRSKTDFLAVMSHELRTPLNAIAGYTELLELGLRGPITPEQRHDLRRVQASQRHLLGLINEVLNYAKLETGAVHYAIGVVRAREALADAEALVAPQARTKDITLALTECDPDLALRADAEKLRQILVNLLFNAVKFTDAGGRIALSCVGVGTQVQIGVRDTGVGIPADQLERIFDPFVQVRADLARTAEGVGLGLAISRDLARGMGGDLTVESEVGVGSVFMLRLPRA